jgi:integrase-like protein
MVTGYELRQKRPACCKWRRYAGRRHHIDKSFRNLRHINERHFLVLQKILTFERKRDADNREAEVTVNVGKGVHIAPSKTPTVREACKLWLESCHHLERTTAITYKQHLHLHVEPYLGHYRLAHLTPPVIRQFEDDLRSGKPAPFPTEEKPHERFRPKRSPAMVKKILTAGRYAGARTCRRERGA